MIKIKRSEGDFSIDTKRFYIPYEVEYECVHCGKKTLMDFGYDHYLDYPSVNEPIEMYTYCAECGESGPKYKAILNISFEMIPEENNEWA